MNEKVEKILNGLKGKRVGVFCDGANIFHGRQKYGWQIDVKKFKEFLRNYCNLRFINYYLATPIKSDISYYSSQKFLGKIKDFITIKSKELKYIPIGGKVIKKGNMDIEIVLDVVRSIDNLDTIIVVSGDSDFVELKNYVIKEKGKNIIFIAYQGNMGWEIRQCWHICLEEIKSFIELK